MKKIELGIEILKILNNHGFEAFIVGGAVRDYLLGLEPNDIDITTSATVDEIDLIFDEVDLSNKKYLNCKVFYHSCDFEITTYRKDVEYLDHRHPVSVSANNLKDDLIRRDFTINAMAMDMNYNIIDLFNGKSDLNSKIIKTIGSPKIRFNEDGLRVLRAIYYSARLSFDLDEDILESFCEDFVKYIPSEYIKTMVEKICALENNKGMKYIHDYKILKSFDFYQTIVDISYKYNCKEYWYVLYLSLNNDLLLDEKLSKVEKTFAKKASNLVINNFSKISLYNTDLGLIPAAVYIYNLINEGKVTVDAIMHKYQQLPIHSYKDIKFDFNVLPDINRGKAIKKVEEAIIEGKLINSIEYIEFFIEKEVL